MRSTKGGIKAPNSLALLVQCLCLVESYGSVWRCLYYIFGIFNRVSSVVIPISFDPEFFHLNLYWGSLVLLVSIIIICNIHLQMVCTICIA